MTQHTPTSPDAPQPPHKTPWWWIAATTAGLTTWTLTHDPGLALAVTSLIADTLRPPRIDATAAAAAAQNS